MAAPVLEGSHNFNTASDSGSETGITIPSGTDCIVVFASIESVTGSGDKMSELCWDAGGTVDFIEGKFQISDDYTGSAIMCWVMTSGTALNSGWPGTGSGKELSYDHDQTPGRDTRFWIGFFSGVDDTNPVEASWSATDEDTNTNVTETSAMTGVSADSYSIMGSYYWDAASNPVGAPSGYGQTQRYDSNSGSDNQLLLSDKVGETALRQEQLDYPISVAIALAAGSTGATIDCTTGAISVTGLQAAVSAGSTIACNAGAVAVTGLQANVSAGATIECGTGAIALAGLQASVAAGSTIECGTGVITVTGQQASVSTGATIDCTAGALTVTGLQASISTGATIDCSAGAVAITGLQAGVSAGTTIAATTGAVAVAGLQAEIDTSGATAIDCTTGAIAITGQTASISASKTINCTTGAVAIVGQQAEIWQGTTIDCGNPGAMALAGLQAGVTASIVVECTTGAVIIGGYRASVISAQTAAGRVTATLTARQPQATLTARQPQITLSAN